METIAKIFAPDIQWTISGRNVISGSYNGQEETFAFFGKLMELTDMTFSVGVHDLLASDDHVVVLAQESASRNGKSLESDDVHVWHVANAKAVEFWESRGISTRSTSSGRNERRRAPALPALKQSFVRTRSGRLGATQSGYTVDLIFVCRTDEGERR